MADSRDLSIDERFVIEKQIGSGAFGEVFVGTDRRDGSRVAIKRLKRVVIDRVGEARFLREALLLARVSHPNLIQYVAAGEDREGRRVLVLEWVDGEDLAKRQRRGSVPMPDAIEIVRQTALGLAALHGHGIVHRDIKPSHLLLLEDHGRLRVKIIDLGIALADSEATESPGILSSIFAQVRQNRDVGRLRSAAASRPIIAKSRRRGWRSPRLD